MKTRLTAILILFSLLFYSSSLSGAKGQTGEVKGVEGNKIIFKDGSSFETTLIKLNYIGRIRSARGKTYLILSGKDCEFEGCDANISIYVHSPEDGPMKDSAVQVRYVHPGKEYDVRKYIEEGKEELAYEGRAFWGRCLPGRGEMVIWHEKFKLDDGSWKRDVYILEPGEEGLKDTFIDKKVPPISQTLKMVSGGKCREIPGISRMSEP